MSLPAPATRAAASLPGSARLARLAAALRRETGVFTLATGIATSRMKLGSATARS